jgi:hypothetical protein
MLMTVCCGEVVSRMFSLRWSLMRRGRGREGVPSSLGRPWRGSGGDLHCWSCCSSSKDLLPLPLAAVREGIDRRLREAGADAGDLDPGPGVGSPSLGRRERVFNGRGALGFPQAESSCQFRNERGREEGGWE